MSDQNSYKPAFFIVPQRIMDLPGLTMAFLRIYETIFQFWNHKKTCYLSNSMIKERTSVSSIATIQEAFQFFEKHNELKRVQKGNKRYLIQPELKIEEPVDKQENDSSKNSQGIGRAIGGYRQSDRGGIAPAIHNNKNINKETKREPVARKKREPLSDNFIFNEKVLNCLYETSTRVGLTQDKLLTKFENINKSTGKKSYDWNAEFENFLINEKSVKQKTIKSESKYDLQTKCAVPWFGENH